MTYTSLLHDNVLLSQRVITYIAMMFWQLVFIACISLISYLFYKVTLPDNRRF
jgi:hypothetical protein